MKKFPVTSKEGNEYMVKMVEKHAFIPTIDIKIYIEKTLFGIKFFLPVYSQSYLDNLDKHNYNYIELAKIEVEKYEYEIEKERVNHINREKGIEEFKDWDGKC